MQSIKMSEFAGVNFTLSLDDFLNSNEDVDGYVEFDIDPSVFDEEMPIPDSPKPSTSIEPPTASVDIPVPSPSRIDREDIEQFISEQENQNTMKKTLSDIKKLEKYMAEKGETRKLHEIPMEELDEKIAGFLMTTKKPDGEDYEPCSIRNMISSFDRKLRRHGYEHSIIRSQTNAFTLTRETLKAKLKLLKRRGKGNRPQEAEPLSDEDINFFHQKNLLGLESPSALINSLWLNNCLHFGMRGVKDHYELRWGDVMLKNNGDCDYLELNERQTKTRTGENVTDTRKVKPKIFSNKTARDPIDVYKKYAAMRPIDFNFADAPFYLAPRTIPVSTYSDQWFLRQRIGMNKLSSLMKSMCDKAQITNRKLTNHSARKHLVQKLRDNNIPPTEIMQITGHKNIQSVLNYSSISVENQKKCSNILANTSCSATYLSSDDQRTNRCSLPSSNSVSQTFTGQSQPSDESVLPNEVMVQVIPVCEAQVIPVCEAQVIELTSPARPEQFHIPNLNISTRNGSATTPIFYGAV